ncbi:unnamed protein product [Amoebophrya sp. A120]|nr:unnamed protein product [Amoebophrya sp. A120]|eukprot:GSA120T00013541001.1
MIFVPAAPASPCAKAKGKTTSMMFSSSTTAFLRREQGPSSRGRFCRRGSCSSLPQWLAAAGGLVAIFLDKSGLPGVQDAVALSFMTKMKMKLHQQRKKSSVSEMEQLPRRRSPTGTVTSTPVMNEQGDKKSRSPPGRSGFLEHQRQGRSTRIKKMKAKCHGKELFEYVAAGGPRNYDYRHDGHGMVKNECKLCLKCSGRSWLKYIDTATGQATSWQMKNTPRNWRWEKYSYCANGENHGGCLESNLDELYKNGWNEGHLTFFGDAPDYDRSPNIVDKDGLHHLEGRCEARTAMKKRGLSGPLQQRFDSHAWATAPSGEGIDWKTRMAPVGWHKTAAWENISNELEEAAQRLGDNFLVVSLSAFAPSCGSRLYCRGTSAGYTWDDHSAAARYSICECEACCGRTEREMSLFSFRDMWRCAEIGFFSLDVYAGKISPDIERTSTFPSTTAPPETPAPDKPKTAPPETPAPEKPKTEAPKTPAPEKPKTESPETPAPAKPKTEAPVSENAGDNHVDANGNQREQLLQPARGRPSRDQRDRSALSNEDDGSTPPQQENGGGGGVPHEKPLLDTPLDSEPSEAKCCP